MAPKPRGPVHRLRPTARRTQAPRRGRLADRSNFGTRPARRAGAQTLIKEYIQPRALRAPASLPASPAPQAPPSPIARPQVSPPPVDDDDDPRPLPPAWAPYFAPGDISDGLVQRLRPHCDDEFRYYLKHIDVPPIRSSAVEWMMEVAFDFDLAERTLVRAVTLLDIYLCRIKLPARGLAALVQLYAAAALLISSKFEEPSPPTVEDFSVVTNDTFPEASIIHAERDILIEIDWRIAMTTFAEVLEEMRALPDDGRLVKLLLLEPGYMALPVPELAKLVLALPTKRQVTTEELAGMDSAAPFRASRLRWWADKSQYFENPLPKRRLTEFSFGCTFLDEPPADNDAPGNEPGDSCFDDDDAPPTPDSFRTNEKMDFSFFEDDDNDDAAPVARTVSIPAPESPAPKKRRVEPVDEDDWLFSDEIMACDETL